MSCFCLGFFSVFSSSSSSPPSFYSVFFIFFSLHHYFFSFFIPLSLFVSLLQVRSATCATSLLIPSAHLNLFRNRLEEEAQGEVDSKKEREREQPCRQHKRDEDGISEGLFFLGRIGSSGSCHDPSRSGTRKSGFSLLRADWSLRTTTTIQFQWDFIAFRLSDAGLFFLN